MDNHSKTMARTQENKKYLVDKYHELVWALSLQDYSNADIGAIMNRHRSNIKRIVDKMPKNWEPKWVKAHE